MHHAECAAWAAGAHRALLGGPVCKALAIPLVDVHRLVAEAGAPGIVVDVPHHLCLHLYTAGHTLLTRQLHAMGAHMPDFPHSRTLQHT